MSEVSILAAESLWSRLLIAVVTPVVGGLIIGGALQWVAWTVQTRRTERDLRHELLKEMTEAANVLYMATQLFWRVNSGGDADRESELPQLRRWLDDEYLSSRTAGLVLESRLEAYFASDDARQRWHRTMDFLTVRYYQVLRADAGEKRATRLAPLYKDNAGTSCTNFTLDRLNDTTAVLQGFRQALSEASILVLTGKLRNREAFGVAYSASGSTARSLADQHPPGEVPATGSG